VDSTVSVPIGNEFDIIIARQKGKMIAKDMGFSTIDQALIETAISELTRNIYSYAKKGVIVLTVVEEYGKKGIEILAQDTGPGIEDVSLAMKDGYSTTNSLGLGLPGVRRLMDDFAIDSKVGKGTAVVAKKWL